eukprot:m.182497 g.182497  ORF g.182497 m.182497 type:complete len:482 (+) comp39295_c0_seq9:3846-5291(+)
MLLIILLLLFFPLQCNLLKSFKETQLRLLLKESCLVACLNPNPDGKLTALLESLENVFPPEDPVKIVFLETKKTNESHDIAVYQKIKPDRTCLLSPTQLKPTPKRSPYTGPLTLSLVVHFINEKCGTFRKPAGGLNLSGLTRRAILNNLYQVNRPSDRCDRIPMPGKREFFMEYLRRSRPVVIEKAAANWTAMKKWTMDFLRKSFGHERVHVKLAPGGEFEGCEEVKGWEDHGRFHVPDTVYEKLPFPDLVVVRPATLDINFSDFLNMVVGNVKEGYRVNNVSAYLEYSSIPEYMPKLEVDIDELPFMKGVLERQHLNMWLSDGNTLGKLHFDPFDNLLCQLSGTKHVTLFEPHDNTRLYESHIPEAKLGFDKLTGDFERRTLLDSTSMVMSPVDIKKPDLERFPAFAQVAPMQCTIHPGDVLFMPAFWWHEVQSTPDQEEHRNMAVNYWYEPFLTKEFPCPGCKLDVNPAYSTYLDSPPT